MTNSTSYDKAGAVTGESYSANHYNDYGTVTSQDSWGYSQNMIGTTEKVTSIWKMNASSFTENGILTSSQVTSYSGNNFSILPTAMNLTTDAFFDSSKFTEVTGSSVTDNTFEGHGVQET